ncbi:rod shape-determining protein RodA [Chromatiales bacterium (ex Bugula neritina AB1)]|nr:rod shape-determining protein RodA [Chromatiales bacterium (ex Bugula neritina AB1)]
MLKVLCISTVASLFMATSTLALDRSLSPEGAELYIISPKNGETISGPVTVLFGLKGMGVAPAGTERENTGHHHLLINTGLPAMDLPVPSDEQHKHFGKGQTETTIELPKGKHSLQLLLGNHLHVPHNPVVASEVIEITVK